MSNETMSEDHARAALAVLGVTLMGTLPSDFGDDRAAFVARIRELAGSGNTPSDDALQIVESLMIVKGNWPAEGGPNVQRIIARVLGWTEEKAGLAVRVAHHKGWITMNGHESVQS